MIAWWCKIDVSRPEEEKILVVNFCRYEKPSNSIDFVIMSCVTILDRLHTLTSLLSLLQGRSLMNIEN